MKIALLTTPAPAASSSVAACVRAALPYLAERFELSLFVERQHALSEGELDGRPLRDAAQLEATAFDQVVYAVANDAACGFMLPLVRRVGGVALLFDWCLADAAHAAYPGLAQGGALGGWLAAREGGRGGLRSSLGAGEPPSLNRSVVRFADGFLVPDEELRDRVLEDRNEPTPTGVFDPHAEPAELARVWAAAFELFPTHRAARKSLLRSFVHALRSQTAARAEARNARRGASGA